MRTPTLVTDASDAVASNEAACAIPFSPMQDYLLLEPLPTETMSEGGIALPDDRTKFEWRGRVLAIGPGAYLAAGGRSQTMLKVDDIVICNPLKVLVLGDFRHRKYGLCSEQHVYVKENH